MGFTTTTRAFEFREGGEWDFSMHGPDGTDYREWITWTEISPPERIALRHGESRHDPNTFESVLTFTPDGTATRIEMRTVFSTSQQRDQAVEKYHAIEGGRQTLSNLAAYVTGSRRPSGATDGREGLHRSGQRPVSKPDPTAEPHTATHQAPCSTGSHHGATNGQARGGSSDRIAPRSQERLTAAPDRRLDRRRQIVGVNRGRSGRFGYLEVDEFSIALSPVPFGAGTRLFDGVDAARVALEPTGTQPTQRVTHLTYAVHPR